MRIRRIFGPYGGEGQKTVIRAKDPKGMRGISNNLGYISRDGKLDLEDQDVSGVGSAATVKFGPVAGGATRVVTVTIPVVAPCGTVVVKVVPVAFTEPTIAETPLIVI